MPSILIFGFGAVGAVYGLILHRANCTITAVCRSNHDHIQTNGMTIRSAIFGHETYHPRVVRTVQEAVQPAPNSGAKEGTVYDYVLVASKALPGTAALIKDAVKEGHTTIVLAQNGIGIEDDYAHLYPSNPLISGVVYLPATQVSPGVVEHGPLQRFEIGTYPSTASSTAQKAVRSFSDLFAGGGASAPVFPDIQSPRLKKLAINTAWNPLTALTLCDDANFLRASALSLPLIKTLMAEIGSLATAWGYPDLITPEFIEDDLARPLGRLETGGKEPSMLVDVKMGRRMEVEAIVGNAVRMAERLRVEVPTLRVVYALLLAKDFELRKDEANSQWKGIARH